MRNTISILLLAATLALGACVDPADDDPTDAAALAYDGVCSDTGAVPDCQCYQGFLSNYVTRVECDDAGLQICEDIGPDQCIDLTP